MKAVLQTSARVFVVPSFSRNTAHLQSAAIPSQQHSRLELALTLQISNATKSISFPLNFVKNPAPVKWGSWRGVPNAARHIVFGRNRPSKTRKLNLGWWQSGCFTHFQVGTEQLGQSTNKTLEPETAIAYSIKCQQLVGLRYMLEKPLRGLPAQWHSLQFFSATEWRHVVASGVSPRTSGFE